MWNGGVYVSVVYTVMEWKTKEYEYAQSERARHFIWFRLERENFFDASNTFRAGHTNASQNARQKTAANPLPHVHNWLTHQLLRQ